MGIKELNNNLWEDVYLWLDCKTPIRCGTAVPAFILWAPDKEPVHNPKQRVPPLQTSLSKDLAWGTRVASGPAVRRKTEHQKKVFMVEATTSRAPDQPAVPLGRQEIPWLDNRLETESKTTPPCSQSLSKTFKTNSGPSAPPAPLLCSR